MAYNDDSYKHSEIKRLFLPGKITFMLEVLVATLAFTYLLATDLETKFFNTSYTSGNELTRFSNDLINTVLTRFMANNTVETVLVFIMWATVGMLAYIGIFRGVQIASGTASSVKTGAMYINNEHSEGLVKYMSSLHNTFIKLILAASGMAMVLFGLFLAFSYAYLLLKIGISESTPNNILPLIGGSILGVAGIRIIMTGVCVLIPPLRSWYCNT